jgi:hypothetical protein
MKHQVELCTISLCNYTTTFILLLYFNSILIAVKMFSRVSRVTRFQAKPFARRKMAGHAAPPPEGGIDAVIHKYLPGNHQV